jgi:2-haloalkanoic acid dehalogenase type II
MMTTTTDYPDLTGFKALSFDCYGTLIDWESGMRKAFAPILSQLPETHAFRQDPTQAIQRFNDISDELETKQPRLVYNENLSMSLSKLVAELDLGVSDAVLEPFGNLPGTWPAFSDTVQGLQMLKKRYKLIILSNINNTAIQSTVDNHLCTEFDGVCTAQDIGSYKPDHANFRYLFQHAKKDLGVDFDKGDLLHVARSLTADHVPAKELGLRSVWISRGGDKTEGYGAGGDYEKLKGKVAFEWRFDTLLQFAEEVDRQFGKGE